MFDRFTDRAKKVLSLARQAAIGHRHDAIGTEHILLGIVAEGTGVAANVLKNLEVDLDQVHADTHAAMTPGTTAPPAALPLTRASKRALEASLDESTKCGHNYIGTEHLLLGLLTGSATIAASVLRDLGIELDTTRDEILEFCGQPKPAPSDDAIAEALHAAQKQPRRAANAPRTVVVIMPAGSASEHLYEREIRAAVHAAGAHCQRTTAGSTFPVLKEQLTSGALVLAVLPGVDPVTTYQLGVCQGMELPMLLVIERSADVPDELCRLPNLLYDDHETGRSKLSRILVQFVRKQLENELPPDS